MNIFHDDLNAAEVRICMGSRLAALASQADCEVAKINALFALAARVAANTEETDDDES